MEKGNALPTKADSAQLAGIVSELLDDLAGLNAASADAHFLAILGTVYAGVNRLQVRQKTTLAMVVGVGHVVARHGALTTDLAYAGHEILLYGEAGLHRRSMHLSKNQIV